ncbi:MAG TPA: tRNA (adenosine(37)-N6)-threonylcarbamoyltransferase complex dimerization subunit type 1 TsaB [Trueperaceae bacterium]|nr:tRNA (adenosine(37)-N6)-threonylcarbamoyltransferase complex dimerization subunit type 1 TsaB [Trueperaceae bacterium]
MSAPGTEASGSDALDAGATVPRLTLAVDCATSYLALALVDEAGRVAARFAADVGRGHAARLVPELETLTAAVPGWRERLARVVAGVGPGSYTGLRVALATASGLARALGAELGGAPTFAALAAGVLAPGEEAVVTLDARRGNVYAAHCRREPAPADAPDAAPVVAVLAGPAKLPAADAGSLAPGARVAPAGVPDAAALVAAALDGPPAAVYL